jgi:hypothetical protein
MMPFAALLVTEAEFFAAVLCAQDLLFAMHILNCTGLKVILLRLIIDNKGTKDFVNNLSSGGKTQHIELLLVNSARVKIWQVTFSQGTVRDYYLINMHKISFNLMNK